LSGEIPLIRKDLERSESFLLRASGSPIIDEEDETDNAIQNYIDGTQSKNLKSRFAEQRHTKLDSPASGSILMRRSAMKTLPEAVEAQEKVVELVPGDDDIENQKTYSQKELNEAKKMLQKAFADFYRSLSFLSSFRYIRLAHIMLTCTLEFRCAYKIAAFGLVMILCCRSAEDFCYPHSTEVNPAYCSRRSVNISAFAKITKKYDEVTGWHLAPIYMKEVESSYFVISKKVSPLVHIQITTSKQHVMFCEEIKASVKFHRILSGCNGVMFSELVIKLSRDA